MRTPGLHLYGAAYVADNATIQGEVTLEEQCSVWYGTVIRGDVAPIHIGKQTNVQDLTVVHPQHDEDIRVGDRVVIGHNVMVHGRTIGNDCLIGMGAILLPGSHVGNHCIVGAGALVPTNMRIPDGQLVMGCPARIVREVREDDRLMIQDSVERYLDLAAEQLIR